MNKFAVAFFALAFVTTSVVSQASNPLPAQTRCTLTGATSPNVRGIQLGMSAQQLLAMFPGIPKTKEMKESIDKANSATSSEVTYFGFNPATEGDAKLFAGVESVAAGIYKARLVDFSVQYSGATWKTVDTWIAKLSESFKLPGAASWVTGPNEAPNKVLVCNGILIEAATQDGSASIRVRNTEYVKDIDERAKAADEKKRQDIKP